MTLQAFRAHLTPLSPIHIGTGESFEPTNYVIDDGWLHEFDHGAVLSALTPADRAKLLEIADRQPGVGMVKAIQIFFFERRARLILFASHQVPVLSSICRFYSSRVGQVANLESNGRQIINQLAIDRTGFDRINGCPILFGSSVKGAIRTALLDAVNRGWPLQGDGDGLHKLQGRLLKYYNQRGTSLELDPLRLLHVSDSMYSGDAGPQTQVWFAVNRKKAAVVDGQGVLRKSQAEAKDLHQILECVLPWQYRAFVGQFNVQHPNELAQMDRRGQRQLPSRELWPFMSEVAQACNRFYLHRLDAELGLLRQRGYHDASWAESISSLLQAIKGDLDAGRVFLLRVGRHSGAESMTLEGVRQIKVMQGRDSPPAILPESKTVWLAATETDQQTGLLPFGWLLVEITPYEDQVAASDVLARECHARSGARLQLTAALRTKRSAMVTARLAIEDQQRLAAEEAAAKVAAANELARIAAAREVARQEMTANRRGVEDFIAAMQERAAQLRGGKDKPNTGFHQRAQQLASAALGGGDWTDEERMAAAAAIEEWLPKVVQLPDVKDAFKKLKLRALRGQV